MQIDEPKIIKTIVPATCPHCNEQIFIGYQAMIPTAASVTTNKDVKKAKEDVLKRLKDIKFKDTNKRIEIEEWLKKESTLIEPNDVDSLIKEILRENKDNDNTEEDTTE